MAFGADAFAAMQPSTVVLNVGRGPTIDERALYDALKNDRIAGAIIDTWYTYPSAGQPKVLPSALTVLLIHEPRRTDPLIELRFFRSVPFSGATLIAISAFGAFGGFLFMNTLYLQMIRGLSPMQAGLCTVPLGLTVLICAPISGRVVGRYGPRPSLLLAGTMICLGASMLLFVNPDTALVYVLASYLAFGVGQGVVNAPITNTAVSGMPRSHAGVAAAVATTSRNIGTSLGVAIVGSILSSHLSGMFPPTSSRPAVRHCG